MYIGQAQLFVVCVPEVVQSELATSTTDSENKSAVCLLYVKQAISSAEGSMTEKAPRACNVSEVSAAKRLLEKD